MNPTLSFVECRVLGSLIEKELTTPEYYPLTLNALQAACNQKSNRDPEMALDPKTVARTVEDLRYKHLAWEVTITGSRVPKYKHDLPSQLPLSPSELAVLCELMLRGPQTSGELRTRASRMQPFADVAAVEQVLQALMTREVPIVAKLPVSPGRREARFAQLLTGAVVELAVAAVAPVSVSPAMAEVRAENDRLAALEQTVATLRVDVDELKQKLTALQKLME